LAEGIRHYQSSDQAGEAIGHLYAELILPCDYGPGLGADQLVDE
jgi:hypothetical protein